MQYLRLKSRHSCASALRPSDCCSKNKLWLIVPPSPSHLKKLKKLIQFILVQVPRNMSVFFLSMMNQVYKTIKVLEHKLPHTQSEQCQKIQVSVFIVMLTKSPFLTWRTMFFSFPITIRTSEMAGKIIKGKANKKNTQKTKISYLHNAKQD